MCVFPAPYQCAVALEAGGEAAAACEMRVDVADVGTVEKAAHDAERRLALGELRGDDEGVRIVGLQGEDAVAHDRRQPVDERLLPAPADEDRPGRAIGGGGLRPVRIVEEQKLVAGIDPPQRDPAGKGVGSVGDDAAACLAREGPRRKGRRAARTIRAEGLWRGTSESPVVSRCPTVRPRPDRLPDDCGSIQAAIGSRRRRGGRRCPAYALRDRPDPLEQVRRLRRRLRPPVSTVRGCWEWSIAPGHAAAIAEAVLQVEVEAVGASLFDAGDGWDYGGRWRADGRRVTIRFDGEAAVTCSFVIDRRRRTLTLSACSSPSYDRTFSRSSHRGVSIVRPLNASSSVTQAPERRKHLEEPVRRIGQPAAEEGDPGEHQKPAHRLLDKARSGCACAS